MTKTINNPYQNCPLHRFAITNQSSIHFHGFYWGLKDSGTNLSVEKAIALYLERYAFIEIDPESLKQGYFRLNNIIRESKKDMNH